MILLVFAAIGVAVLIFSCICLIVGIVTRRNPLSYILDKKPTKVEWVCVALLSLMPTIYVSLIVYSKAKAHALTQSGWYQYVVACVLVQLLMSVTYSCLLIYAIYKNR